MADGVSAKTEPEKFTTALRRAWVPDEEDAGVGRTHWVDCWKVHHECATAIMCDQIDWLQSVVDEVRGWSEDRALPANSEFVQGVRSAQDKVGFILGKHEEVA